jgi:hypothetical protein
VNLGGEVVPFIRHSHVRLDRYGGAAEGGDDYEIRAARSDARRRRSA